MKCLKCLTFPQWHSFSNVPINILFTKEITSCKLSSHLSGTCHTKRFPSIKRHHPSLPSLPHPTFQTLWQGCVLTKHTSPFTHINTASLQLTHSTTTTLHHSSLTTRYSLFITHHVVSHSILHNIVSRYLFLDILKRCCSPAAGYSQRS